MHSYKLPYLQPYKGKATRHTCPACGAKESFSLYISGKTNELINSKVGKCNRESKCGYHYTPKQFFSDNPQLNKTTSQACDLHYSQSFVVKQQISLPIGNISFSYVERSASYQSNFVRFLCEFLTTEQISSIGDKYALGATRNKEIIFWQIDIKGKVHTGKIMQYNPLSGKRIKHESGAIDWVHNKLKKSGTLPEDYNLLQCFFGEHLLRLHPEAVVCIVESEKSALISAAIFPEQVWLATGGIGNLTIEKCQVLRGRNIILYPDLNAFEKWSEKAELLNSLSPSPNGEGFRVRCSTLLENIATPEAKAKGLDVADYLINQLKIQQKETPQVSLQTARYTPQLQSMIEKNKSLKILIHKLELIEL